MSSNLGNAFAVLLMVHSRAMTIERPGVFNATAIRMAPSNYFRNLAGPEESVVEGKEFVVSKKALDTISFPLPIRRGDRLEDTQLGTSVISEVREMFGFGGAIIGYRLRIS